MVDVWKELGKAIGAIFKPIFEIPKALWKALGEGVRGLVGKLMGSAGGVRDDAKPTVTKLFPDVLNEASAALGAGSPPKEIKESVDKFIKSLMEMVEKEAKTEGKSLPDMADLAKRQAALAGGIVGMYALTHAISIALDASQPFKDWGFKSAIMDILFQFKMSDVIGPMIQAPIWASVVVPMRMRANERYPYQVPGTGVLPYLRAKGLITAEEYGRNMKYHALDPTWADHMLENTARYPSFAEVRTMVHRGVATWADVKISLEKSLIHADYVDRYEKLLPSMPGMGDLITMMVREVITKAEFIENAVLLGFSAEWADNYYENHWILLPLSEVKKARHRGDIDDAEFGKFLVLHDYKPEPRPDIETSDRGLAAGLVWDRPGRIDARWLFRWGEIDTTGLQDLLVDDGLDPAYAPQVARATAKNQFLTLINREIANSKADFVKGRTLEAALRADLSVLGLRSEMVDYHVADALSDRSRAIFDDKLRTLRSQYVYKAKTMDQIIAEAEGLIVDEGVRKVWLEALPTAKSVMVVEETFTTEVNRLVANAKYDHVRGYRLREALVSRLQLLDLPDEVIEFHVMDAMEDRERKRNDERLAVIHDMWMKDVETDFYVITEWVEPIIVDEEARGLWLDDAYFDKLKTVRV